MLFAEDSTTYPNLTRGVLDGGIGFDYKWNMGWMNDTLRYFAKYLRHILLAAPSTGGAVSLTLRASPCSPAVIFFEDLGCTKTLNVIPAEVSFMDNIVLSGSILYRVVKTRRQKFCCSFKNLVFSLLRRLKR